MQSPQEFLLALGIKLASYGVGTHQATCPKCSANRQKRLAKCLTVRIQSDKIFGGCNHCGWTFPEAGRAKGSRLDSRIFHLYENGNRKVRNRGGTPACSWQHKDADGTWVKGSKDLPSDALYRYDEVVKVLQDNGSTLIAIAEGESDVDALWLAGIPATCNAHGASELGKRPKWTVAHSKKLGGARLCVFNDNDSAGYAHADTVVKCSTGISQEIRRLDLKDTWPEIKSGEDVRDWLAAAGHFPHTPQKLIELMEFAPVKANGKLPPESADPTDAEIDKLAHMSAIEFEKALKPTAEKLNFRVTALERIVKDRRAALNLTKNGLQGRSLEYEEPEPWLDKIRIADLLDELVRQALRFTVFPKHGPEIAALWIVHSYCLEATDITPRLRIRAPERECGKSTLLDFLAELVYRATPSSNVSTASLFRAVEKFHPTLLIDEADSFARDDNDVRNVLNSGHHIRGYVLRCEGDQRDVRRFTTFAPLAYAHLGDLSSLYATLVSRSIEIVLARRLPTETIESLSEARRRNEFAELRRKLKRFALDYVGELGKAHPTYPERVTNDRQRDNWRPLLAIADLAGPEWGERARNAIEMPKGTASIRELLLADIYDLFERNEVVDQDGFMFSAVLAEELVKLDDRPWSEWGKQRKPITGKGVGKLLSVFDISARKNRAGTARGYYRADFAEIFARYRTPPSKAPSVQPIDDTTDNSGFPKRPQSVQSPSKASGDFEFLEENQQTPTIQPPTENEDDDDVPFF